eukprot:tig00021098_g18203.t1
MRSEFFRAMLGARLREAETGEIDMSAYPRETVLALLRFLYTGDLPVALRQAKAGGAGGQQLQALEGAPLAQLLELARAAHYYRLPRLLARVEGRAAAAGLGSAAAALDALAAAEELGSAPLSGAAAGAALGYVRGNKAGVASSAAFRALAGRGGCEDLLVHVAVALASPSDPGCSCD